MPSPTASPLRPSQVPVPREHISPDQARGSGLRSGLPPSSPVNAHLSPRHAHAGAPSLNPGMGQPASPPRFALGNLRPRDAHLPEPMAHLPHQVAAGHAPAGQSGPVAAHQTTDLPKVGRRLDRWADAAKNSSLPPGRVTGISVPIFQESKNQSIDTAHKAVNKAAQTNATRLQIESLQATRLPSAAISELQGLEHLALKGTLCRKIDFTPNFDTLKKLELHGNVELDMLPENIRQLQALNTLDIRMSPLMRSLPSGIGALTQLETLRVTGTSIRSLPVTLTNLGDSLRTLDISAPPSPRAENGLQSLPDNIGLLKSLTTLRLRGQEGLNELPASLGNLSKLETLDLSGCTNLKSLPDLSKLSNLKTLDLSWCSKLSPPLESLAKLPANCKITLADHWQQQKLDALRSGRVQQPPGAAGTSGRPQSPPRSPGRPAELQQTLDGWKDQLKVGKGERGADRFNIWMGKMLDTHGSRPDVKADIQAVVTAAAESPVLRAQLFALAAENVKVPRNAFGVRQPDRATVTSMKIFDVHTLLLKHQVTDPRLDARQAFEKIKNLAANNMSFARELMPLAYARPARPGAAESPRADVPPVLAAYVQTHDPDCQIILGARRELEGRQGGRSSHDDATAHAAAMEVNNALLHSRYVAVAKVLIDFRHNEHFGRP